MSSTERQEWIDTGGKIANRTNHVINGLLEWADKEDVNTLTRKNIEDATRELTPVDGDDTVGQYVERVVENGPFSPKGSPALWNIDWDDVE